MSLVITLEKDIYFPGEVVSGVLRVYAHSNISCRGLRIHLQGKGMSHITVGSGDKKKEYYHQKMYANTRKNLWGPIFSTVVLDNAGENAIFGPPWAPEEGVMSIPFDSSSQLAIRVMDYDWGKKDDILGEVAIDVLQYVDRGIQELVLTRNGKPEKGKITFVVTFATTKAPGDTVRLQIISATGLRTADWVGKNDVYIQSYYLSNASVPPSAGVIGFMTGSAGQGLPTPPTTVTYPAGTVDYPFFFQLPSNLPSSFAYTYDNNISYSIYANIDVAWKTDPTTRRFFTVIQPHAVATMMTPMRRLIDSSIYPRCCLPPICCFSFPLICFGSKSMKMEVQTDRTAFAPGEVVRAHIKILTEDSDITSRIKSATIAIKQIVHLWARGREQSYVRIRPWNVSKEYSFEVNNENTFVDIPVESWPPTYAGGLGRDAAWTAKIHAAHGNETTYLTPDPVYWTYELEAVVVLQDTGMSLLSTPYTVSVPIVIAAIGLSALPSFEDSAYWEAQERVQATQAGVSTPMLHPTTETMLRNDSAVPAVPVATAELVMADWTSVPRVAHMLPAMASQCTPTPSTNGAVQIVHGEEDCTANKADLNYAPTYYVSH